MDDTPQYVNVRIGRMTYRLSTGGNLQKTYDVAATANAMMNQVNQRHPNLNQVSQAILALVNAIGLMEGFHEELKLAFNERDLARMNVEELKAELNRLREQFWEMKKDLLYYKNLSEAYEDKMLERRPDDQEMATARQQRRSRRTLAGDYQMTIEETLPEEQGKGSDKPQEEASHDA